MPSSSEIHPDIANLVSAGRLPAAVAAKVSALTPGTFVSSKNFGSGKIAEWDTLADRLLVDFEGKPGHALKLEFAAKLLDIIPEHHVLARRFADKSGLVELAEKDPAAFVRLVLEGNGRKMSFDAFEDVVKGKVLTEARFKGWWENAKKVLRTKPQFIVPPKRTLPLELRGDDVSPTDALLQDFRGARELKAKIKAVEAILKEPSIFGNPAEVLLPIAKEAEETAQQNLRLKSSEAIEMLLTRDDLVDRVEALKEFVTFTLPKAIGEIHEKLHDFVTNLTPTKQFRVFDSLPEALGEGWTDRATTLINKLPQRSIGELAKVFSKRQSVDKLMTYLKVSIGHRMLGSEALAWICRERAGITKPVFSAEITPALMGAIERDHFDDDKRSNRVMDVMIDDKNLISDILALAETNQVNNFARQVMLSPAFDELTKRSLMARIIKIFPEVEALIHEQKEAEEDSSLSQPLIVSWGSLEAQKAAHKHLTEIEIPKNREDISIAREYGDLRENFEYKSAKEYQRVLERRKMDLERDLARAQGTDFTDVAGDRVGYGTIVELEATDGGKKEKYTILGAWDGDPENHILSYLTAIAQALAGKTVGDVVELPTEVENITREVKVVSVKKWAA